MATIAPAALVIGATRRPLPYGLFSVFTFRPETSGRWENGAEYETLTCQGLDGLGLDCNDPESPTFDGGTEGTLGESEPFAVYGHFKCSPVGWTPESAQERATEHLLTREEQAVENALWTGDLGNAPALATSSTTVLNDEDNSEPVPVTPRQGVALLEQWIGETYGSLGLIHMTRAAATLYKDGRASGGQLRTILDTPIVAGSGYPGTGPEGESVEGLESWIYASPAIFGYRTDVYEPGNVSGDLLDRGTNDLYALASRTYLLGFDPCGVAAVKIDGGL